MMITHITILLGCIGDSNQCQNGPASYQGFAAQLQCFLEREEAVRKPDTNSKCVVEEVGKDTGHTQGIGIGIENPMT